MPIFHADSPKKLADQGNLYSYLLARFLITIGVLYGR